MSCISKNIHQGNLCGHNGQSRPDPCCKTDSSTETHLSTLLHNLHHGHSTTGKIMIYFEACLWSISFDLYMSPLVTISTMIKLEYVWCYISVIKTKSHQIPSLSSSQLSNPVREISNSAQNSYFNWYAP